MIKAALVGVTGYTGMELVRLLTAHPHIQLTAATSRIEAGKKLGDIYPFLRHLPGEDVVLIEPDPSRIAAQCDIAFLAIPHTAATETAAALLDRGIKVIDLSADFRLKDATVYEDWYKVTHSRPDLLPEAVYGLPELYAQDIQKARLVANPGCYPTSVILALAPALKNNSIYTDDIVIDAKSGASGAGRTAVTASLFCEVHDTFRPYNLGKHRHTPEIEQELSYLTKSPLTVSFNPHLVPMGRGILSTIYTRLQGEHNAEAIHAMYTAFWETPSQKASHQTATASSNKASRQTASPWIRILPLGELPDTRHVRGTMFCDIGLTLDPRTQRLIITSAIDNVCRGASGQALANANLMFGLPVTTGLMHCALLP